MKNILIINQKCGVGKTLAADSICDALQESDIPFNLYDLDGQGGLSHEPCEMDGAEISIIDTPGALQSDMGDWIQDADLIIIPTRPTLSDMPATNRTIEVVQENNKRGVPVVYVVNGMNRFRATEEFMEYFMSEHENDMVYGIPQSEAFIQAKLAGVSIQKYNSKCPPAIAMKKFTDKILELCGIAS